MKKAFQEQQNLNITLDSQKAKTFETYNILDSPKLIYHILGCEVRNENKIKVIGIIKVRFIKKVTL